MIQKLTNRFNGEEISVMVVEGDYNQLESKDVDNIKKLFGGFASFAPDSKFANGQDYVSHRGRLFPINKNDIIVKRGEDYDSVMEVYTPGNYSTFSCAYLSDEDKKTVAAPSYECVIEFLDLPVETQKELHRKYNEVAFLKSDSECYLLRQIFGQHIAEDRIETFEDWAKLYPKECLKIQNVYDSILALGYGTRFARKTKAMMEIQVFADNYYGGLVNNGGEEDAWGIDINPKTGEYCSVYVNPDDSLKYNFPLFYNKAEADKFIKFNAGLLNKYFR